MGTLVEPGGGTIAGGAVGGVAGAGTGAKIGAVAGAVIGGIIGALTADDTEDNTQDTPKAVPIPDALTATPDRDLKENLVIVRGGATNDPPLKGITFSGAFGITLHDAASGVPHGQVSVTTVSDIRRSGGIVIYKPEEAYPGGPINYRHVNITLGSINPFVGPIPNPVPKDQRISGRPPTK